MVMGIVYLGVDRLNTDGELLSPQLKPTKMVEESIGEPTKVQAFISIENNEMQANTRKPEELLIVELPTHFPEAPALQRKVSQVAPTKIRLAKQPGGSTNRYSVNEWKPTSSLDAREFIKSRVNAHEKSHTSSMHDENHKLGMNEQVFVMNKSNNASGHQKQKSHNFESSELSNLQTNLLPDIQKSRSHNIGKERSLYKLVNRAKGDEVIEKSEGMASKNTEAGTYAPNMELTLAPERSSLVLIDSEGSRTQRESTMKERLGQHLELNIDVKTHRTPYEDTNPFLQHNFTLNGVLRKKRVAGLPLLAGLPPGRAEVPSVIDNLATYHPDSLLLKEQECSLTERQHAIERLKFTKNVHIFKERQEASKKEPSKNRYSLDQGTIEAINSHRKALKVPYIPDKKSVWSWKPNQPELSTLQTKLNLIKFQQEKNERHKKRLERAERRRKEMLEKQRLEELKMFEKFGLAPSSGKLPRNSLSGTSSHTHSRALLQKYNLDQNYKAGHEAKKDNSDSSKLVEISDASKHNIPNEDNKDNKIIVNNDFV